MRGIAKRFDMAFASAERLLKKLGIRIRNKKEQKRYKNAIVLDAMQADQKYVDGISITKLSEDSGLDAYSVRCYLVDKGIRIRGQGEQKRVTHQRQRQAYAEACADRKKRRVSEATFYIAGEKIVVKYDEEGREL